jgi:hypothetical protein
MQKALMLAGGSLLMSSAAMADICTDHGYPMGTQGYLECWRIVSQQQMQQQLLAQRRLEMLLGATAPQQQPQTHYDDPPPGLAIVTTPSYH